MMRLLASLATTRPWQVLATMAVVTAVSFTFSAGLTDRLSGQGFAASDSESSKALDDLADVTDVDVRGEFVALVQYGRPIDSTGGRRLVDKVARKFDRDEDIAVVKSPFSGSRVDKSLISDDGRSAIVIANLKPEAPEGAAFARLRDPIDAIPRVRLGGGEVVMHTVSETVEQDLKRAELIAFPLLFVIALFVFRGLIAALLPLLVGGITIPLTFALIRMFDGFTDLSVFALNLTTGLGLGLAIDYSLLLVTRFREEIAVGAETAEAVRRTVGTAGRTVVFSAVTVAAALGSMAIFPLKFLYSMGIGGATVALVSATVALTVVPALLMLLGPRIDRFGIPRRSAEHSMAQWHRLAEWVMKRPALVAVSTFTLLAVLTLPAAAIKFTSVDSTVLGRDVAPRVVQETVDSGFPRNDANARLWVLLQSKNFDAVAVGREARRVRRSANSLRDDSARLERRSVRLQSGAFAGSPAQMQAEAARIQRESTSLERRSTRLDSRRRRLERRADRLERFTDRIDAYAKQVKAVPGVEAIGETTAMGKGTWRFEVYSKDKLYSPATQQAVIDIRALDSPTARQVGGTSAAFVDQRQSILERTPHALALIGAVTFIALFMMTGSVILPIKTFLMNLVTLGATFGVLVWIFQEGHLEGLLRYESQGAMEMTQPVLLFALAFGLATDYGVFLLSRIKELHDDGENDHDAVANGVARTGRVISSAALLFCVAIICFSTSGIVFIKELGIGAALAVAIDASIVRVMLVPALMTLLGRWNWWAPGPMRRFHDRFGISEGASAGSPVRVAPADVPVAPPVAAAVAAPLKPLGGDTSQPFAWGADEPAANELTFLDPGQDDNRPGLTIGIVWQCRRKRSWHVTFAAGRNHAAKQ
ncbi:MAG: MMPL family transporter [Thermoleophilaceae bacterium]|nr:MMPL family transporter [Thermoleophilaceae bacterium]